MSSRCGISVLGMALLATVPVLGQDVSPQALVERYATLDFQGAHLTPTGFQEMQDLFTGTERLPVHRVVVVRAYSVYPVPSKDGKVWIRIDYNAWGDVDPATALFSRLPPSMEIRHDLLLVKASAPKSEEPTTVEGSAWRIQESVPNPSMSVESAIRYVEQLRDNSQDAVVKENANRTIATLKRLR